MSESECRAAGEQLQAVLAEVLAVRADLARLALQVQQLAAQLAEVGRASPGAAPIPAEPPREQLVDLDQMAAMVNLAKKSLHRYRRQMPAPIRKGTRGRCSLWRWADVRPWLEAEFGRLMPERFPEWTGR